MLVHDLVKIIPNNATTEPKKNWENLMLIEYRYRLLNIPGKGAKIEVTKKLPFNNKRKYLTKDNKWIYYQLMPIYESYVTHTYYAYTSL